MSAAIKVPDFSVPSKIVITSDEYHAHPAVGSSSLKHMLRSPAHYHHNLRNRQEPTAAMALGTAIHEAILEPNLFEANAIVMPKFEGKGSQALKDQWLMANHGRRVLKGDDYEMIQGILLALKRNSLASQLLDGGAAEESYFWQDPETGIVCKCRPDYLRKGHIILDVKSTIDASLDGFPTQIARLKYNFSAAMYLDGVTAVTGEKYDEFIILAIEKEPPYAMGLHLIDAGSIDAGRMQYKRCLKILKQCREQNSYPSYEEKIFTASLPAWAFPVEDID